MDRVKSLESALREAKEGAMRDRKRFVFVLHMSTDIVRTCACVCECCVCQHTGTVSHRLRHGRSSDGGWSVVRIVGGVALLPHVTREGVR